MLREFEVDGKAYGVVAPSLEAIREANKVYNTVFADAIKSGAILRVKLEDTLRDQGLWDQDKEAKYKGLQEEIRHNEILLASKGKLKLTEAKKVAMKIKKARLDLRELISKRLALDSNTAESQAENAKFDYLVFASLVYKEGKRVFENLEDFLNHKAELLTLKASAALAESLYGLSDDTESNYPENKFFRKYKFADSKNRLIDSKGRLIDDEGRLIDENGRFINEQGEYVDIEGNPVNVAGDYDYDGAYFLDDEGNPIPTEEEKTNEAKDTVETPSESVEEQEVPVVANDEAVTPKDGVAGS